MSLLNIISQLLPVLLLILLGILLKRAGVLTGQGIATLKQIIVNVGLPAALFISFLTLKLEVRLLYIVVVIFFLNLSLFFLRKLPLFSREGRYQRFLFTGFEYGMFAMGLFSVAYGREAIPFIALVDLGHEFFIWFLFVPAVSAMARGEKSRLKVTALNFLKSPIIIGILLGLAGNILGLSDFLQNTVLLSGFYRGCEMVSMVTGPLILMVLGAGLQLSTGGWKISLKLLLFRLPFSLALALGGGYILNHLLKLPRGYSIALFVLLTSPPPYVLSVYMGNEDSGESGAVNSALTLYTLASLVVFTVFYSLNPTI